MVSNSVGCWQRDGEAHRFAYDVGARRATFLTSPYVDNHGEEDVRLQRGK